MPESSRPAGKIAAESVATSDLCNSYQASRGAAAYSGAAQLEVHASCESITNVHRHLRGSSAI